MSPITADCHRVSIPGVLRPRRCVIIDMAANHWHWAVLWEGVILNGQDLRAISRQRTKKTSQVGSGKNISRAITRAKWKETALKEYITYNNQCRRLPEIQMVRKEVRLLLGTGAPRSEKCLSKMSSEAEGRYICHVAMSAFLIWVIGRVIGSFFNWVHLADTRSNEIISINSEAAGAMAKQKQKRPPCLQAVQCPWKSDLSFSKLGSEQLLIKSHSLDHNQGHLQTWFWGVPLETHLRSCAEMRGV